jgi:hypothetical protein
VPLFFSLERPALCEEQEVLFALAQAITRFQSDLPAGRLDDPVGTDKVPLAFRPEHSHPAVYPAPGSHYLSSLGVVLVAAVGSLRVAHAPELVVFGLVADLPFYLFNRLRSDLTVRGYS